MLPAMILIFIFGIFPVAFAFFVSLHRWRRFPREYQGLFNYVRALDGLAYVVFFWLALGAIGCGVLRLWKLVRQKPRGLALSYLIPGAALAGGVLAFINWLNYLLPLVLMTPQRLRGQERVQGLFVSELFATFQLPESWMQGSLFLWAAVFALACAFGWLLLTLTITEIESPAIWSQGTGYFNPITSVTFDEAAFAPGLFPDFSAANALVNGADTVLYSSPNIPACGTVRGLISEAIANVTSNGTNAADAAAALQAGADQALADSM